MHSRTMEMLGDDNSGKLRHKARRTHTKTRPDFCQIGPLEFVVTRVYYWLQCPLKFIVTQDGTRNS